MLLEYPRPQMVRPRWQNLNGLWDYALTDKDATAIPARFDGGQILVPFPCEAALSGVGKKCIPEQKLWYGRTFTVPADWAGQRVILHFGAVNYESVVYLNGRRLCSNKGGYNAIEVEANAFLQDGPNELVVSVQNPVAADVPDAQVLGKQRKNPGGIFYTPATGIWQTVWIEPVPDAHVMSLKMVPNLKDGTLKLTVGASDSSGQLGSMTARTVAKDGSVEVATATTGDFGQEMTLKVPAPHPWTPGDPHLYTLRVELMKDGKPVDAVDSYFAMRSVSVGKDERGRPRILLNGTFVFEVGPLDQGYWPDGIYTAPTDAALKYDLEMTKKLGFNLSRKHARIEPQRWYYWADTLGVLVWQDMPQMFGGEGGTLSDEAKRQFKTELGEMIAELGNHPSIIVWTTFNEGWGQHDTAEIVALTKKLDPTRLVNDASGWVDKGVGDLRDTHAYPGPWCEVADGDRATVNGEFGGIGMKVDGHMWAKDSWGYEGKVSQGWYLTKKYQRLLETAYKLRDERGMSAAVYTQLTDVEQEANGLLTYDRAVVKGDLPIIAGINQGKVLPLGPNPNPPLVPTSDDEPQTWSYTTEKPPAGWEKPGFDAGAWKTGPALFGHDMSGARTPWETPDIWIRREFTLPADIPAKLELLVKHDEDAEVWINGEKAATAPGYAGDYAAVAMSDAARASLKPGKNVIAVHCHQTIGGQGIGASL